jgi:hypothetical protein
MGVLHVPVNASLIYLGTGGAGTPFVSFSAPNEILALACEAGFKDAKTISTRDREQLYFTNPTDNRLPASGEVFLPATTQVTKG